MPHLSLRVLGAFTLMLDKTPAHAFKSDKARALLIYLAVEADRAHRRERLAGLLWPDFPNQAALARFSDTLSNLRQIIGDRATQSFPPQSPFLIVTPTTAQFNLESDYALDLREFIEQTRALSPGFSGPVVSDLPVASSVT